MKRTKDYTSEAVKASCQATMTKVENYFDKQWAPGKEYNVIKHIQGLLDAELDKHLTPTQAGNAYRHLACLVSTSKKYDAAYAKYLEQYGPNLMPLLVEYGNSLVLKGRYDVGERYHEVSNDILDKMQKDFLSKENIEKNWTLLTAGFDMRFGFITLGVDYRYSFQKFFKNKDGKHPQYIGISAGVIF